MHEKPFEREGKGSLRCESFRCVINRLKGKGKRVLGARVLGA